MIAQLGHLLEMAARPNVELRILPDDRGWHPGLEGAFTVIESAQTTVVFVETRRSDLMLHQDGDVAAYKRAVSRISEKSLQPDVSANLIADLRNRMEKNRGSRTHLAEIAP